MTLTVQNIQPTNFTGSRNQEDKHVRASEVGVATGATVGGAKYGIGAFKRFKFGKLSKVGDVVQLSGETTKAIKNAANAGKEVKTLWGKMHANAKNYKNGIINWCKSRNTVKALKPIFESKAFAKVSGAIGAVTAGFVFISGVGEMGNVLGKLASRAE